MPLKQGKKNIGYNISELVADNKKSGKERGANGKVRPMRQIVAIALSVTKPKNMKKTEPKHSKTHEKKESKAVKAKEKKIYKKS